MPEEIVVEPVVAGGTEVVNTPTPVTLKDDDLVEVVVRGEKVTKSWKDARSGIQMHEDYTRGTQANAKTAKELQDIYEGLTTRQKAVADKEAAIDAILGRTGSVGKTVETPKPDEVLTYAQLQEYTKSLRDDITREVTTKFEEQSKQQSQSQQFQRWEDLAQTTVETLSKEDPALKDIPQLDTVLKREAMKDKPTSERELVAAMVKAGKNLSKVLEDRYNERDKAKAARREALKNASPAQVVGTPQIAAPTKTYMKGNGRKIDYAAIEADAIAALDALEE